MTDPAKPAEQAKAAEPAKAQVDVKHGEPADKDLLTQEGGAFGVDEENETEEGRRSREKIAMGAIYPQNDPDYVETRAAADAATSGDDDETRDKARKEKAKVEKEAPKNTP